MAQQKIKKQRKWSGDSLLQSLGENLQNTHQRAKGTPGGKLQKALVGKAGSRLAFCWTRTKWGIMQTSRICRKWSVSVATGEERLYTGKSITTGWRQFRPWVLILTLGHKENSDHLEGSLGHSQTEGPWEREKEITCSNDESSKQRFDKKKGRRKKIKPQQGKGASKKKKKKYCHRAHENSNQKIKKT